MDKVKLIAELQDVRSKLETAVKKAEEEQQILQGMVNSLRPAARRASGSRNWKTRWRRSRRSWRTGGTTGACQATRCTR